MIDPSAAVESVRTFDHHGPELLPLVQFLASGGIGLAAALAVFARTIRTHGARRPTESRHEEADRLHRRGASQSVDRQARGA